MREDLTFPFGQEVAAFGGPLSDPEVDGAWHHVAVSFIDNNATFYVDGQFQSFTPAPGADEFGLPPWISRTPWMTSN